MSYRSNWGRTHHPDANRVLPPAGQEQDAAPSSTPGVTATGHPEGGVNEEPRAYHQGDPGDECDRCHQLELDMPRQCECGATRPNLCTHDANLRWAAEAPARRPKTCLRRVDPATAPFPEGF